MQTKISVATQDDFDNWLELAAEVEPLFGPMVHEPSFLEALRRAIDGEMAYCIREGDGAPGAALCGGVLISRRQNRVGWLAVAARHRGRGVGRALLAHALANLNLDEDITVQTFAEGVPAGLPARRLYGRFGFVDDRPCEPTPAGEPTVLMRRRPGPLQGDAALHRLSEHVYWLDPDAATDRPIIGAVAGERGTLIVEGGNSPAHAALFLRALSRLSVAPPTFLALTHWHWDHVFGAHTFGLPTIASQETRRIVAEMARLDWGDGALDRRVAAGTEIAFCRDNIKAELPDRSGLVIRPPDIAFDSELLLDLGGVTARLILVGGDHGADCSVIYVPEDRVMFLGDCLGMDYYHGAYSYTAGNLYPLYDHLLSLDVEHYLPAHDTEPLPRAQLAAEAAQLKEIGRTVERLGGDREAALSALRAALGEPLSGDVESIVEAFVAGLAKPAPGPWHF